MEHDFSGIHSQELVPFHNYFSHCISPSGSLELRKLLIVQKFGTDSLPGSTGSVQVNGLLLLSGPYLSSSLVCRA